MKQGNIANLRPFGSRRDGGTMSQPVDTATPIVPDLVPLLPSQSHPLPLPLERFLASKPMRAIESAAMINLAVVLVGWALGYSLDDVKPAMAIVTAIPFGLLGLANIFHLAEHVITTSGHARAAWRLHSPPNPTRPSAYIFPEVEEPEPVVKTEYQFVDVHRWNAPKDKKIPVDGVEIDTRDFAEFLWEAWEGEGGAGRSLKRDNWLGAGEEGAADYVPPYKFRESGHTMGRDYYDALIQVLDKRMHVIEGMSRGHTGRLKYPPSEILDKFKWS